MRLAWARGLGKRRPEGEGIAKWRRSRHFESQNGDTRAILRAAGGVTVHPKFYWFDCGVFAALRPRGPLDRAKDVQGAALEGLVAQHLLAWIDYGRRDLQLHFWRTRAGSEVDFVLYGADGFHAIEVKASERVRGEDLRSLRGFAEDYPEATRTLLYRGREELVVDGVRCLPVDAFLRAVHPSRPLPIA